MAVQSNRQQDDLRGEAVAFICAELLRLNPTATILNENTDITTDLRLDSVAIMDLVFALEEKFDLSISLNALADTCRIGELADLVCTIKDKA